MTLVVLFAIGTTAVAVVVAVASALAVDLARGGHAVRSLGTIADASEIDVLGTPGAMHVRMIAAVCGAVGAVLVIGIAALVRTARMRSGVVSLVHDFGARFVDPGTRDALERRLINVVEEMAIASGMPVPPVVVMEDDSINAFAAGWSPEDAIIGVTRGALRSFSRDELQGVVAHEFSHVAHRDVRLNMRMVGLVYGMMAVALIGSGLLRAVTGTRRSSRTRGSGRSGSGAGAVLMAIIVFAVVLLAVGWIGRVFGRLMQAAVSRQREFLADATAVDYTRWPGGIAGALRRIAGTGPNRVTSGNAAEFNHIFFTEAFGGLFASHPPLAERIDRIEARGGAVDPEAATAAAPIASVDPALGGRHVVDDSTPMPPFAVAMVGTAVERGETPEPLALDRSRALLGRVPDELHAQLSDPWGSAALLVAVLLDADPEVRRSQQRVLDERQGTGLAYEVARIEKTVRDASRFGRLLAADLAAARVARLPRRDRVELARTMRRLIAADGRIDRFEWFLGRVVVRRLEGRRRRPGRTRTLRSLDADLRVVLGAIAHAAGEAPARDRAFAAIAGSLDRPEWDPPTGDAAGLPRLDSAFDAIAALHPIDHARVLAAALSGIESDGVVRSREYELVRVLADAFDQPLPPILPDPG